MPRVAPQPERVYLDYHATTPVDPRVQSVFLEHVAVTFGNPSSVDHSFGDDAEEVVAAAAADTATLLGASPEDVVFTAGATESINLALQGFARWAVRKHGRPARVAVSAVEHRAVLDTARALAHQGHIQLVEIPVDGQARLVLETLTTEARRGLDLVCVMAANNEVGTVYPVIEIGTIASEAGAMFLCDATQAVGKIQIDVEQARVTYLALSAHKFYGPKGVGALLVAPGAPLDPIIFGGGHQRGLRPGTINAPGVAALGMACRLRRLEMNDDEKRVASLRDALEASLRDRIPRLVVNGAGDARLAGSLHVSLPGVSNDAVVARIREIVAVSTGAACSSGIHQPSHVLRAMRLPRDHQEGAIRLGLGKFTTETDVRIASEAIATAANALSLATI